MKKTYLLLGIIFSFQVANSQTIIKATLAVAPFSMTTIIAVTCDMFEFNFKDVKKVLEVKNTKNKNLEKILSKSLFKSKNYIDVRGELTINYKNENKKIICFDKFGWFYDGKKYFQNKLLFNFIMNEKLLAD